MNHESLIAAAKDARSRAHAPYSNFQVGAALECSDGTVFTGCNVENISYGLTICAERVAIASAVAAGHRSFRRIAVVADTRQPITPCGACRQVMAEFCDNLTVVSANFHGEIFLAELPELLPRAKAGILDK
jgi:cytidine deaminase